jgi:hypothetical protein
MTGSLTSYVRGCGLILGWSSTGVALMLEILGPAAMTQHSISAIAAALGYRVQVRFVKDGRSKNEGLSWSKMMNIARPCRLVLCGGIRDFPFDHR